MKGKNRVGVALDQTTEPEEVYRLLDRAIYADQQGYIMVLDTPPRALAVVSGDDAARCRQV